MEIELERTFLLKKIPKNLKKCKSFEILDIYLPAKVNHPILRIRKSDNKYTITKKERISLNDCSEQTEKTIPLSEKEYQELSKIKGKRLRKIRYYYPFENKRAEIDFYLDELEGLITVDFEFKNKEEKDSFIMPEFCLADITQEKGTAGGILAGKDYAYLKPVLDKYDYKKIKII